MFSENQSLRMMVEHWLPPGPENRLRVTAFKHQRSKHECYVCVEVSRATGPVALFFFRHRDGTWRVFPPRPERPAMRAS